MRTTLDIDDDVLQAAKELASRDGATAGQVLSSLARRGLNSPAIKPKKAQNTRGGVPLLPSRGELITLEHLQQLADREGV